MATLPGGTPECDLETVRDVCRLLGETIHQVRTGQIDPRIANTVGYLSSVMVRAIEVGDLEERLAQIEGAMRSRVGQSFTVGAFDHNLPAPGPGKGER